MFSNYLINFKQFLDSIECTKQKNRIKINEAVAEVIEMISNIHNAGRKIFWIGNGGSAAIAEHSSLDYFRTGNIKTQAFNDAPLVTCLGNDFGYPSVFQKPIEVYAEPDDMLVAISSSGKSVNILNGVTAAKQKGSFVITFSGFAPDNPLRNMGDINFYVPASHYGYVELIHGVLCHSFLDLYMANKNGANSVD